MWVASSLRLGFQTEETGDSESGMSIISLLPDCRKTDCLAHQMQELEPPLLAPYFHHCDGQESIRLKQGPALAELSALSIRKQTIV